MLRLFGGAPKLPQLLRSRAFLASVTFGVGVFAPKVITRLYRRGKVPPLVTAGESFDGRKWPAFRDWDVEEVSTLRLRVVGYASFETAFPFVPAPKVVTSLSNDVKFFAECKYTAGQIIDGNLPTDVPEIVRPVFQQLRVISSAQSGEGLVDALAAMIAQLFQLGSYCKDGSEFTSIQDKISLVMGRQRVEGALDVTTRAINGKFLIDIFEDKIHPKALGYVEEDRPQIAGYLVATCIHNLGEVEMLYEDQEAFIVNLKGTTVRFFHLRLSVAVMQSIKAGKVPHNESEIRAYPAQGGYDLLTQTGRSGFVTALTKIKHYIRSSEAKIE